MDIFIPIINFFIDKSGKTSVKIGIFFFVITFLLLIDNTFGFSYYYNTQSKIEQVKGLNEILKDTIASTEDKLALNALKEEILYRKTFKDYFSQLILGTHLYQFGYGQDKNKIKKRAFIFEFLSSSWIFILMSILLILNIKEKWLEHFSAGILSISFGLTLTMLFSTIPTILNIPIINYVLNAFLSLAMAYILYIIGTSNKNKKT